MAKRGEERRVLTCSVSDGSLSRLARIPSSAPPHKRSLPPSFLPAAMAAKLNLRGPLMSPLLSLLIAVHCRILNAPADPLGGLERIVHLLHIEQRQKSISSLPPPRGIRITTFPYPAVSLHFLRSAERCKSAAIGVVTKFRLLFHLFCGVKGPWPMRD